MALKGPTTDHNEIRAWAESQGIVPAMIEPNRIDAEPACMSLLHKMTVDETRHVKEMNWDDFLLRFDLLGLTLVYDEATVFNEILKVDESLKQADAYRKVTSHH